MTCTNPEKAVKTKPVFNFVNEHNKTTKLKSNYFSKLRDSPVSEGKRCRENKESTLCIIHSAVLIIEFVFL